jgi:hypothetical protein
MRHDAIRVFWILAIVACLALPAAAADEPGTEPWISIHKTLLGMRNSIYAVDRRLKQELQGVATGRNGGTWFEACCSYNVAKINNGVAALRPKLDYLEAQYASREELQAIIELNTVREHLEESQIIFNNMGNSTDSRDAQDRLMAIIHPFTHAQKTLRMLESRYPVPPPPVKDSGGTGG